MIDKKIHVVIRDLDDEDNVVERDLNFEFVLSIEELCDEDELTDEEALSFQPEIYIRISNFASSNEAISYIDYLEEQLPFYLHETIKKH